MACAPDAIMLIVQAATQGDYETTSNLLKADPSLLHVTVSFGQTLLHLASERGHTKVAVILLESGADINATADWSGRTPLHHAARHGHLSMVMVLLEANAAIDVKDKYHHHSPLHLASKHGHCEIVEALVKTGADPNAKDLDRWTALHLASEKGHHTTLGVLLMNGAATQPKNRIGYTALHLACWEGHLSSARVLLEHHADISATDKVGQTPLHCASQYGHSEVVSLLLASGAEVNGGDHDGDSPLHLASDRGHASTVSILIANGGNVNLKNLDGFTPLHWASEAGHDRVVELLVQCGGTVLHKSKDGTTPVDLALKKGHESTVKTLTETEVLVTESLEEALQSLVKREEEKEDGKYVAASKAIGSLRNTFDAAIRQLQAYKTAVLPEADATQEFRLEVVSSLFRLEVAAFEWERLETEMEKERDDSIAKHAPQSIQDLKDIVQAFVDVERRRSIARSVHLNCLASLQPLRDAVATIQHVLGVLETWQRYACRIQGPEYRKALAELTRCYATAAVCWDRWNREGQRPLQKDREEHQLVDSAFHTLANTAHIPETKSRYFTVRYIQLLRLEYTHLKKTLASTADLECLFDRIVAEVPDRLTFVSDKLSQRRGDLETLDQELSVLKRRLLASYGKYCNLTSRLERMAEIRSKLHSTEESLMPLDILMRLTDFPDEETLVSQMIQIVEHQSTETGLPRNPCLQLSNSRCWIGR